jgi:uncharacterized membrane protein YkvA (DUF1232 family)
MNNEQNENFDTGKAAEQFEHEREKAEETLNDKEKTSSIIEDVFIKLKNTASETIAFVHDDIVLLLAVVSAYITGRYTKIPFKTLAMILGALTYFLSPLDLIFDFIPVIGFLDDVFIIGMTLKYAHDDLQTFKEWEKTQADMIPETKEAAQ